MRDRPLYAGQADRTAAGVPSGTSGHEGADSQVRAQQAKEENAPDHARKTLAVAVGIAILQGVGRHSWDGRSHDRMRTGCGE